MNPFSLSLLLILSAEVALAQTPATTPPTGGGQTVITSDSLDLNLSKTKGAKQGLFRGNVKVEEPRFVMTSKEMTVFFADDDSVQDVEAREEVVIERKDGSSKTWSEKAIYNMKEKKLTLLKVTKQPKLPPRIKRFSPTKSSSTRKRIKCSRRAQAGSCCRNPEPDNLRVPCPPPPGVGRPSIVLQRPRQTIWRSKRGQWGGSWRPGRRSGRSTGSKRCR